MKSLPITDPNSLYEDIESLRQQLASRDAEVAELRQEHINATLDICDCQRERDQLREELSIARMQNAVVYGTSHPEFYKTKEDELREDVELLREAIKDALWQETWWRIKVEEALAATEPTSIRNDT